MDEKFKASDEILKELVEARREEVEALQRKQADEINDLESRGRARLADLKKKLPKEFVDVLNSLEKTHDQAAQETKEKVESLKEKFAASAPRHEDRTDIHPGLAGGQLVAPGSLGRL